MTTIFQILNRNHSSLTWEGTAAVDKTEITTTITITEEEKIHQQLHTNEHELALLMGSKEYVNRVENFKT